MSLPNTLIKTEKSFLTFYDFDDKELVSSCVAEVSENLLKDPKIFLYGKECIQHRSVGFFSNTSIGYKYSGQLAKSQPLSPNLSKLLEKMNYLFKTEFNGILINRYENGLDYIGAHSDDEKHLSPVGVVAISYGAVRKFRIRDKVGKNIVMDIQTNPFEIIHMGGEFQKEFLHEIPVEKKIKDFRISFTFRKHDI